MEIMKKTTKVLAVSLTMAFATTLIPTTAATAATVKEYPQSIASLGDSMTQGATTEATKVVSANGIPSAKGNTGLAPQNSWSTGTGTKVNSHYQRLVAASQQAVTSYNDSKSGSRAGDLARQAQLAASQKAEYVTILSGTNDICGATSIAALPSADTYKENVRAALQVLQNGSNPDVLVSSLPSLTALYDAGKDSVTARYAWAGMGMCSIMLENAGDNSSAANFRRDMVENRVQDFNLALKEVCSEFSKCVTDDGATYALRFTLDDLSVDYFHPSISGQNKLAAGTWEAASDKIFTKTVAAPEPVNTKPVITGADNITVPFKSSFNAAEGVTASDDKDGDVTGSVKISGGVDTTVSGAYTVEYTVTDSKGLTEKVTRVVTVDDNKKPLITNVGSKTIGQYLEFDPAAGIVGKDAEDGDITDLIKYTGEVDYTTPGVYTLRYTLRDSDGGFTISNRTITVTANSKPVITAGNHSVKKNTVYSPAKYVTATDAEQGNMTSKVTSTTTVNPNVPGDYTTTYTVVDNRSVSVSKTVNVTVY